VIHLYTWKTPNGRKPAIALAELGIDYRLHPVNIGADEQFAPDFLAISPNNKIPALVDDEAGVTLFESGAILEYLADKSGRLLPAGGPARYAALEWLYWQVGGVGPMFGQLGYFANRAPEKLPLAIGRFVEETVRLFDVLERRLSGSTHVGGDEYGIADIALYPWVVAILDNAKAVLPDVRAERPAVARWLDAVGARPAVRTGMAILA
jgi:GST-like protein